MTKHKYAYLTEMQIGDKLWGGYFKEIAEDNPGYTIHREMNVGLGIADFVVIGPSITTYELKITASIDAIIQLIRYGKAVDEYLRLHFYCSGIGRTKENYHKYCPRTNLSLIARHFDTEVIETCHALDIETLRVKVESDGELSIDQIEIEQFPDVPNESVFLNTVRARNWEVQDGSN